jgi:hypothetical protein
VSCRSWTLCARPLDLTSSARSLGDGAHFSIKFWSSLNISSGRRGDVPDLTADPTLAEQELGFKAPQDLETMCRDLWNWQTKNPFGYGEYQLDSNGPSRSPIEH